MKTKIVVALLIVAFSVSCAPVAKVVPTETPFHLPTLTNTLIQSQATPTDIQLPLNEKNAESQYCQSPAVRLPISDAQGLSDDEIAGKLMDLWLSYFNTPLAPDYCRIDGYHIDKVFYDAYQLSPPIEPQGDIMRVIHFSIKLVQRPSFWASNPGEIDPQNWLHTGNSVAVFRSDHGYTMQFAYP
jgi:hypothetical protein